MKIIISNQSELPIYAQIREQIKEQILNGQIKEGEILPSIRSLAKDVGVSVITTTRAYTDLENDGYIMIVQGKGCFVKELNQNILEDKLMSEIEIHFAEIWKNAKILKKTDEELLDIIKILMEDLKNEQ